MAVKKGLGAKGLGIEALINHKMEDLQSMEDSGILELDIHEIEPNRKQPRKYFEESALEELAASLKTHGMIQPVVVKKNKEGYYELIAGERRWRAAKIAGLRTIPAICKDWEESVAFEAALVENLQREDLNPMEEAQSYARLQSEFHLSQEQIADKVGKSRPAVANALRLLQLDSRVQNFLIDGRLTAGHARAILAIASGDQQFEAAEHIIENAWNVRQTEAWVKELSKEKEKKTAQKTKSDTETLAVIHSIEENLKQIFSTKVKISQKKNKGKIEIEYYSPEDLDRLFTMLQQLEAESRKNEER